MIRLTKHFLSIGLFSLVAILACASLAHAQGSRKDDVVFNAQGRPMAGATVRVCTSAATGQPCPPLALIYSDAALTQALANPLSTDGLGNYSFYAAPGRYMIELSGPGITTKQLQNVILPSDPSSPTFTTVTTTSGISAFSLTLAGNLTVNGSTSVTGSLTVGGAPVPSTNADNQWGANQRFKGPIPYRDATTYGAVSSTQTFAATCASGSPNVTLNAAGDWANGQYISVEGCGAAATVSAPTLTPLSISAISRSGNVVTATVSSTATVFAGYYVQVAAVSNGTFNGVFFTTSSGGTSISWNQTAADASSSGGTVSPAVALYEGTNPGSTAHTYNVCSVSAGGGCSAKSATLTVSNDPATLTELDYNWLYFGAGTGNGFPTGVDYYCVYRDNNFIGRAVNVPGYKDDGTVWARNTNCPATAPSAATAETLTTTIVSGAGTTSLVLAANAGTSGSGLFAFHDSVPAINAALADVATDTGGKPMVVLPAGNYYVSRLVIDTYTLEATGSLNLTTHPIRIQNAGTLNGHGATGGTINENYNQVRIVTGNVDGILFPGGAGGNTARNFQVISGVTHDILFGANGSAGGNGITVENFSGSHFSAGDCLYSDSNIIFVVIKNFQCIAADIADGAPTNRSAMYLSNLWAAGSWVDWDLEDIFFDFGDFHLDSPAPSILGGASTQFREITIKRKKSEGGVSKGNFTVDAGCQQSPVNNVVTFSYPHFEDFGDSDRAAFAGFFYAPRAGTAGCTSPTGVGGNTVFTNIQGADPMLGADVAFPQDDPSVGLEATQNSADSKILQYATRIGSKRTIIGSQFYMNYKNPGIGDVPAGAYIIPANNDFAVSDDGPGGSCAAGLTYYFKLSQSDGVGWTKVDSTTQEHSLSTGAGSRFIGVFYGVGYGSPRFLSPKYRIWFSTTPGAYTHYVETTNQGFYDFGCPAGTVATPPATSTAYYWKVSSETGDPNWWGTNATDKLGFGKTDAAGGMNIKYLGDSAGIISADKGFHAYKSAAPTCLANEGFIWYDTTSNIWKFCNDVAAAQPVGNATITCSGTLALGTAAIGSASKTALTMACTGLLTTDNVIATFNADPTGTTGYAPSTSGMLTIVSWPTANTINVDVINNTSSSITPSASLTLNVIGIHHP